MINISYCKVLFFFFFLQNVAGEKDDATSIFPWDEEGRPDQLLLIVARTRVCARARWLASARSRRRRVTPVSIYTADYVERTVKWKRRRHNRSRYGIINAVPLNFCAPLSSNSSDELVRGWKKRKKKKKNWNTMNREKAKRKGIDGGWGWLVCFGSSLISVSQLLVSFFNYSFWFFFFFYVWFRYSKNRNDLFFAILWKFFYSENLIIYQVWEESCVFKRRNSTFRTISTLRWRVSSLFFYPLLSANFYISIIVVIYQLVFIFIFYIIFI